MRFTTCSRARSVRLDRKTEIIMKSFFSTDYSNALFSTRRRLLKNALSAFAVFEASDLNLLTAFAEAPEKNTFPDAYNLTLAFKYSRKKDSYTQGLLYEFDQDLGKDVLYESGGKYGLSLLRKVEADTGKVLKHVDVPRQYFAEGLACIGDRLYMLTWLERACLVYDKKTFKQIDEFRYQGQGWGLAYDGVNLVMSDGSSRLRFIDPNNFRQLRSVEVHYFTQIGKRRTVKNINELEIVNGEIWANVYQEDYVVRIDPSTGLLIGGALNFSEFVPDGLKSTDEYVLNGLAFDQSKRRLYVTGKCWPVMYVFNVEPREGK